jgi:hypothetical protein
MLEIVVHWILWPGFLLFALLILPIPPTRRLISSLIRSLGRIRVANVSVLLFIAFAALLITGGELLEWYTKYSKENRDVETIKIEFMSIDASGKHGKRWRLERNIYMGALTAVLYLSLHTIADLINQVTVAEKAKAPEKKNQ